ncbi:SLAP domain-containing protein [Lactobacillus sp. LL6]|uniref:SLAP domain-containing protein n=1 Tax=Lactobacillus sp. LL6 TaxID=2596827 RepID=UPI0011854680|nr:SLAP domain-containing protein [Lactobacillus sp. LL6]TSO26735.1 hypothetical protein FOD82_06640 [Lactobacillus sp. LL6]
MKLNKNIIIGATALALGSLSVVAINTNNSNYVSASAASTKETTVKLRLNHNSYIYDKNGKRLKKYKGKKALIKKSQELTIKGKIEPIQKIKRYYFYIVTDSGKHSTPYWMQYKKIKGDYYYNLGNGSYIKCINVKSINGNSIIPSQATVIVKPFLGKTTTYATDDTGKATNKVLRKNEKLIVDNTGVLGEVGGFSYHIKGTDYWVSSEDLKAKPRTNYVSNKLKFDYVVQE